MTVAAGPAGGSPDAGRLSAGWWARTLTDDERKAGTPAARPSWADLAEQAVAVAAPAATPGMDGPGGPLRAPLYPFLFLVRQRIADGARSSLEPREADPRRLADTYAAAVGRQLFRLARRTLLAELRLAGTDPAAARAGRRQRLDSLAARLGTRAGLAAFLSEYPVLTRLLGVASVRAAEEGLELLDRFARDRAAVVAGLLDGRDPGPLVAVEPCPGGRHRDGRTAAALSFADGRRVIYKPRDLAVYAVFGEVIDWLNGRVAAALRAPAVVLRPGYGWLESVESQPLPEAGAAADFFWRAGALLAALYATRAAELDGRSLVARGTVPVLVDAEALFQPSLPGPGTASDPAAEALDHSVRCTALVARTAVGDGGGAGGGAGGVEPAEHEPAILRGFRAGYDAITADRQAFLRLVEERAGSGVRTVIRPARGYARLLEESTAAHLLRDARDRERGLDALLREPARHPLPGKLARHERADLRNGDIPLFTAAAAERDVWISAGRRLPGVLDRTGLSHALDTIAAMGETDRRHQEWVISACLATRRPHTGHRSTACVPGPVTATAADPGRLLAAACGVGDQIVARAITGRGADGGRGGADGGRVNWLGLRLVKGTRWVVAPMGAALADGYLGVALFLAQLSQLTGIGRYAELARRAVIAVPELLDGLDGSQERISAIGAGAMDGLGGISYGLARMSRLLSDPELSEWSVRAAELAAAADERCAVPGWAAGSAGCLAAMGSVHAETGSRAVGRLARACADRLSELVDRTGGRCLPSAGASAPPSPGFAEGGAGVGWALHRFARLTAEPHYRAAGRRAAGYAVERAGKPGAGLSPGWCSGSAGMLLGSLCLPALTGELESAISRLAGRPVLADLSLCHGELGIAEVLAALTVAARSKQGERELRRRAGLVLDIVSRQAPHCGTPGGLATPGMLNGLAGIGYGLLRFGFADRVPSALLLESRPGD